MTETPWAKLKREAAAREQQRRIIVFALVELIPMLALVGTMIYLLNGNHGLRSDLVERYLIWATVAYAAVSFGLLWKLVIAPMRRDREQARR